MSERFYSPQKLVPSREVVLDDAEAHHLAHVLRLQPGDEVILFDGAGTEATARIETASKRKVALRVLSATSPEPAATPRLTLATAVPKGDRFRWLIEKATELGVDRLIPLNTERSVVDPRETKLDKMRQAVIAACKQCGRNRLMEIAPTQTLAELLEHRTPAETLLVADRAGQLASEWGPSLRSAARVTAIVGPEGGLSTSEVESIVARGGTRVSLGRTILRIETAALALAAVCGASFSAPSLLSEEQAEV